MKNKTIVPLLALGLVAASLSSCNYNPIEMKYDFRCVAMDLNKDGEYEFYKISKWTDYEGEQIQIQFPDGQVFLTSSFNCILMKNCSTGTSLPSNWQTD